MLNNTYTVGTSPYNLTFTKRFDTENAGVFTVKGLAPSVARDMSVKHQAGKGGKSNRHMADTTYTYAVPGTTTGATYNDRVYLVVDRNGLTSDADIKGQIATFIALVNSPGFIDSLLAKEV